MHKGVSTTKNNGFTIVELMIAILIGVIITGGLISFVMVTSRTVTIGDALSRSQTTGRHALEYISSFARTAGYSEDISMPKLPLFITAGTGGGVSLVHTDCGSGSDTNACAANDVSARGDRLALPYFTTGQPIPDCTGQVRPAGTYLVNVFWVDDDRVLQCRAYDGLNDTWLSDATGDDSEKPILTGIETMEFLVGVADSESELSASRYITVDKVIEERINSQIRSIRVSILTSSQQPDDNVNELQNTTEQRTYSVLDKSIAQFDDAFVRRVYTTTISFPNSIYY